MTFWIGRREMVSTHFPLALETPQKINFIVTGSSGLWFPVSPNFNREPHVQKANRHA